MTPTAARKLVAVGATAAFAVYASVLRHRVQWLGTSREERDGNLPRR